MLSIEHPDADGIVRIRLTGDPSHADYASLFRQMEALLREKRPGVRLHPTQRAAVRAWWSARSD